MLFLFIYKNQCIMCCYCAFVLKLRLFLDFVFFHQNNIKIIIY